MATIPSGTSATLIGTYRSVAITPITLALGYYEVGGFAPGNTDKYIYDGSGTTLPGIFYCESHVGVGPFAFAGDQFLSSTKQLTANFEVTPVSSVPEPATTGLLSAGMGALALFRRRRA